MAWLDIFFVVEHGAGGDSWAYIIEVTPANKPKPPLALANTIAAFLYAGKDVRAFAAAGRSFPKLKVTQGTEKVPGPRPVRPRSERIPLREGPRRRHPQAPPPRRVITRGASATRTHVAANAARRLRSSCTRRILTSFSKPILPRCSRGLLVSPITTGYPTITSPIISTNR